MDLKKICLKAIAVIAAVFTIPLGIWCWDVLPPKMLNAISASANIAYGLYSKAFNTQSKNSEIERMIIGTNACDIDMAPDEKENRSDSSVEVPAPKPSQEVINALPYPDNLNDKDGKIIDYYFEPYSGEQYINLKNGGQVRNCTDISNDTLIEESEKDYDFTLDADSKEPQVLIYHTHTTESFELKARDYYDKDFSTKTTDPKKNITSVGDEICKQLDDAGIAYIHDTLVHDYPDYDSSYQSSRSTVQQLLKKYPSIKIALDIHRDGIEREDGTRLAPTVEVDGKKAAQIMIISGCDDGTMNMPNYLKNFHFASALQSTLASSYEGLARPILFDYRFYNQDLTTGSLLIEIGAQGNSLDQVQYSGELIGKSLVKMFKSSEE
ncbi:MAG: stage II sporulation protein P [Oscillospiraceae bacterium]